MKWSVAELRNSVEKKLEIDEVFDLTELIKKNHDIRSISPVKIKGSAVVDSKHIDVNLNVSTNLTLVCSVSLSDVDFPMEFNIVERFVYESPSDDEVQITGKFLELISTVWQHIVLNIPIKIVAPDARENIERSGNDWAFMTEDEYQEQKNDEIDPRLLKLKEFFADEK